MGLREAVVSGVELLPPLHTHRGFFTSIARTQGQLGASASNVRVSTGI